MCSCSISRASQRVALRTSSRRDRTDSSRGSVRLHELSQVVHDLAGAQRLGPGALEQYRAIGAPHLARPHVGRARLDVVGDRAERLVELVRELGREPLDGGDPQHVRQLGLLAPDLLLRLLPLGDVADRADEPPRRGPR